VRHAARIGGELTGKILGDFQVNLHGGLSDIIPQASAKQQPQSHRMVKRSATSVCELRSAGFRVSQKG
jgi:hypothetical protein